MAEKAPTITDVAKKAKVGVGTVSRVLNDDIHVNEQTRKRVLDAIRELNYQRNTFARGLKTKNSQTLGVLVADITNTVFSKIIRGMEDVLLDKGYSLLLCNTNMDLGRVDRGINTMVDKQVDGIFILGEHLNERQITRLKGLTIPIVTVTMQAPVIGQEIQAHFASITINNERAAYAATSYLLTKGCRKIALLMSLKEDENVGAARFRGYRAALDAYDIPLDEELIHYSQRLNLENGYQAICELEERGVSYDAVFAVSDHMALGAMRALQDRDYRIPEDLLVVGFDGIDEGRYSCPTLTTIDQPRYKMGQESARLMLSMLSEEEMLSREIALNFEFIERASTKRA